MKIGLFIISMIFIWAGLLGMFLPGIHFKNATTPWELQTVGWILNSLYFQIRD